MFQNGNDARHVRRKGAQALLDALLVADVGKYFRENGKLGAVERRNVQACLSHQREKPDCF